MLGKWISNGEYQRQTERALRDISAVNPDTLLEYQTEISKLYILNLDPLKRLMEPLYSTTGRPATNQSEIFRSFVLMIALHLSLDVWIKKLRNNKVLQIVCGFMGKLPGVASYYNFINRLVKLNEKPRTKARKQKPRKKLDKGKKMPPKHPGITKKLVEQILTGRRLNNLPERILQELFAALAVQPSIDLALLTPTLPGAGIAIMNAIFMAIRGTSFRRTTKLKS